MKKLASVLAIVLAFTMMMSLTSFAADPAFAVKEGAVIPEGTTVTPAADSIAVETAATAGNYYGVLLVEGNALPTVDNAILYINQATAADVKQAFSVLPIIPEVGKELTLYISSNVAGAELIAIPMVYDAEEEIIVPAYALGDVTMDEWVDLDDAYIICLFDAGEADRILAEGYEQFWGEVDAADADAVALGDVTMDEYLDLDDAYVICLYDAGETDRILAEGYEQFWSDEE